MRALNIRLALGLLSIFYQHVSSLGCPVRSVCALNCQAQTTKAVAARLYARRPLLKCINQPPGSSFTCARTRPSATRYKKIKKAQQNVAKMATFSAQLACANDSAETLR